MQLATTTILRLVVYVHALRSVLQQRLDLAAAVDHAGELQQLAEPDRLALDQDLDDDERSAPVVVVMTAAAPPPSTRRTSDGARMRAAAASQYGLGT